MVKQIVKRKHLFDTRDKKVSVNVRLYDEHIANVFRPGTMVDFKKPIIFNGLITYCPRLVLNIDGNNFSFSFYNETKNSSFVSSIPYEAVRYFVSINENDLYVEISVYDTL